MERMKNQKAKCPECKQLNELVKIPGGFYFDTVEYRCGCGYVLIINDYNFSRAMEQAKEELKIGG